MSGKNNKSRRRFLKATGAAALTAAIAGCSGSSNDETTDPGTGGTTDTGDTDTPNGGTTDTGTDTPDTTEGNSDAPFSFDQYPYGLDNTITENIQEAARVMEEAGYGPNNRYELNWLQYKSPAFKQMAKQIRSRLKEAHINMSISSAAFGPLLNQTKKGKHEAFTLSWIADYPGPKNFVQLLDPPNTVLDENANANGARIFWSEESKTDPEIRQFATEQFDKIANNPQPTDEARRKRAEAAIAIEEANWASVGLIPLYHGATEYMWHDWVDYDPPGAMGGSRAKANNSVNSIDRDRLPGTSGTVTTLDPVASGDTASGSKIQNMFDALTNYPNGQTNVETLLAEEYEVSDDLTTYTFTLKEGVKFHDGREVTADDVVYSFRRLMESLNSTNARFPRSVMSITHETEVIEREKTVKEDGEKKTVTKEIERAVPNSLGVEATGEYEVEIEIEQPFAYSLSVLAYSAFSVIPEGIVGDIEGYEGEMSYEKFSTSNPVGCGPFEFDKWEQGNGGQFVMDTFDGYHGEGASFDGIDLTILTGTDATYKRFLNEESAIGGVPTSRYSKEKVSVERTDDRGRKLGTYGPLEGGKTVNYAKVSEPATAYIGFHMEKVPKAVRKAMAYVVGQQSFAEKVFKSRVPPAYHITPPRIYPGRRSAYDDHYQG